MILLSMSLAIVTKKLLNISAIILELDSVLLFMFMDLIIYENFMVNSNTHCTKTLNRIE